MRSRALPDSPRSERGAVLFLALMMMAASVLLGLAYTSAASSQLSIQDRHWARARAQAIAEGGLDMALHALEQTGSAGSVGATALGEGSYSYEITPSAGGYDVHATGVAGGSDVHYQSRVTSAASELEIESTILTRGSVRGDPATPFHWSGTLRYSSSLEIAPNGPVELVPPCDPIELRASEYAYTSYLAVPLLLLPGNHDGSILCEGDPQIFGSFRVQGSLFVNGNLTIDALGGEVHFNAEDQSAVLFVRGNLTVQNASLLSIQGSVFVEGNIVLDEVNEAHGFGSLVSNGHIDVGIPTGTGFISTWEFDPNILEQPPREVDGGPRSIQVTESWRRYYTDG